MRVVADTNVLVSALLWSGSPHTVLRLAETGRITCYTTPTLIKELEDVLARQKFTPRLRDLRTTPQELVLGYLKLARLVLPRTMPSVVTEDPDDDAVLACAAAANATFLITGDPHLLRLETYQTIQIVSPRLFLSTVAR